MSDGAAFESQVFALNLTPSAVGQRANLSAGAVHSNGDFFLGPENRLAGQAIEWLLKGDGHCYSPLVLFGQPGTGKSRLAQAAAASCADAVCTSGADFACELAEALELKTVANFRAKYRTASLLVIEDLEQLLGHRAALAELRNTLDEFEAREAMVVITSRLPPKEMARLPKSIRSRASGGLVVTVSPPGVATRQAILEQLAAARGLSLGSDAAKLLAERLNVTAAELNGALLEIEVTQLVRLSRSDKTVLVTLEHVKKSLTARRHKSGPTLPQITRQVAKYYGVNAAALLSSSRRRQAVLARNVAIYLGRKLTGQSLQSLGRHFGGRDHTTVLHGYRSIDERIPHDASLQAAISTLQQSLLK